ncbi:HlyD family secretion protein [Legionella longbeachae]|uniref:HlyD family secretion protein n=1 Tax=Legionella longbeachae serogroup 1 (strain NSW150) TaxID=661367 RepID=D3HK69_LEGLN|nr:HlyD family secretion protein [Legionella longbeachae]VEE03350.1 hemolysin D [Legionella oakridgensis]HBD7397629.1 HlyD family secretion protein [Legionella pneumophila]ARB93753.1 HlyD family secretion protein [Legionella longbeachae]ARM33107.1 HlyD family secretion protein [Legionella longbeachae]EEZ94055.1 multidrug resistance protein [Legionella longbeachae D-4968]
MKNFIQFRTKIKKRYTRLKRSITLVNTIIFIGILTTVIYIFSYLFPFTDNAFVVNNVRPVAALTSGYITDLYVQNGDVVKKGQKLFTVFQKPYIYTVEQLTADLASAQAQLAVLKTTYDRDLKLSENEQRNYIKLYQDDQKYRKGYRIKSVSLMTLQNSQQETQAAKDKWQAALKQLEIDKNQIEVQGNEIKSIYARLKNAKVNLELTNVYAQGNGIIQNLFFTIGTPVNINQPLFSLVDTDNVYIQANFNETDLRDVRKGSKVLIFPRMYLSRKVFHGVVESDYWSANRQLVDNRTQLQNVVNENQWILLPQRLPVIIRITDLDPHYPLRVGTSAYVYIKV